jgi:hypothetical protein
MARTPQFQVRTAWLAVVVRTIATGSAHYEHQPIGREYVPGSGNVCMVQNSDVSQFAVPATNILKW